MFFHLRSRFPQQRTKNWPRFRPTSFRPYLEPLESRLLLTTDVWTGAALTNNNWTTAANWMRTGGGAPQPGDILDFPDTAISLSSNNDFPNGTSFAQINITSGMGTTHGGYTMTGNSIVPPRGSRIRVRARCFK